MSTAPCVAFIALGSNLNNPKAQVMSAQRALDTIAGTRVLAHSRLVRSPAMGPAGQPEFVNGVSMVETSLDARDLLEALFAVERAHGRDRSGDRWGPRTLDLDLLLYGNNRIDEPGLAVPHPGLTQRSFVLYPLAELDPDIDIPGAGNIRDLLAHVPADDLTVIED